MNQEKKENLAAKHRYAVILKRNKQINKVNIVILGIGLLLTLTDYKYIGEQVIWLGMIIFAYAFGSNVIARISLRKLK